MIYHSSILTEIMKYLQKMFHNGGMLLDRLLELQKIYFMVYLTIS